MSRSTVIRELSECLQARLQKGLRAAVAGAGEVPVYLVHPRELERADVPAACLYLWQVAPEPALRARSSTLETRETRSARGLSREYLRWAPAWITCRYAISVSGRRPEDEQDLIAAALQTLNDQPSVPIDFLPSLAEETELAGVVDRFPVAIGGDGELWRALGLVQHVLLISIEATVPLPSERREAAVRVFERHVDLSTPSSAPVSPGPVPPASAPMSPAPGGSSPAETSVTSSRVATSQLEDSTQPAGNGGSLAEPSAAEPPGGKPSAGDLPGREPSERDPPGAELSGGKS